MPAEAGIQEVVSNNDFKNLDSRFRGNDGVSPFYNTVAEWCRGGKVKPEMKRRS
jgi:hypothetical protein